MVGIKETPLSEVLTSPLPSPAPADVPQGRGPSARLVPRTHIMFSHTVKGQLYNMELLGKFLASENPAAPARGALLPRLVDYELLTGPDGKRTVGFGWYAGGECYFTSERARRGPLSNLIPRNSARPDLLLFPASVSIAV